MTKQSSHFETALVMSPSQRDRIDSAGWLEGDENGNERSGGGGRDDWNRKALRGQCGNLGHWKLPGTYVDDPSKDS